MTSLSGGPLWSAGECAVRSIMSFGASVTANRPCGAPCQIGNDQQCKELPSKDGHERQNVVKYDTHGNVDGFSTDVIDSPAKCVPTTMAAIKTGLRLRFGSATTKNKDGFCRFCVSGGIHIPGRKQVKFIESVSKTPEWEKFSNPSNKYGKCKRNSDCMSNMCYGNNFGLNQGYCAPYKLPLGSPCFYKQSCGVAEYNSKCVGNAFGRQGVCWWKDATKMESCTSDPKNSKKGGCECSGDKQCHSKLCLGGWWGAFGSVGVCQTAPKPKKGAQVGDLDHGKYLFLFCFTLSLLLLYI